MMFAWVRTPFDAAIQPGPKDFDFNLQQFSITEDREKAVDFSSPYYETRQVVITTGGSAAAGATSLDELKGLIIGAQTGTTSFIAAENTIAPDGGVQAFNSNDDAKAALEAGQVDAIVVDLPTAFYLTAAEVPEAKIVGQFAAPGGDDWGAVLEKDSPLTDCVNQALADLEQSGELQEITDKWMGGQAGAPELQ